MLYQHQVDYGDGYEDAFPEEQVVTRSSEENPAVWLASVEAEGTAYRARVMMGSEVIEERNFVCVVAPQSRPAER